MYFISLYFTEDKSINPEETNTLKSFLELHVITFLEQCFLSYSFSLGWITQGEDRYLSSLTKLSSFRWLTVVMKVGTFKKWLGKENR